MSTRVRQIGSRTAHPDPDLPDLDEFADEPPEPRPRDPARIAAALMLARALETAGATEDEVGRDGAVCLVITAEGWAAIVRDEWQSRIRGGESCQDGSHRFFIRHAWAA